MLKMFNKEIQLIKAAEKGQLDRVKALVEAGVDVNACHVINYWYQNALLAAARYKRTDVALYLLEQPGVNIEKSSDRDRSNVLLSVAARKGCLKLFEALLEKGANPDECDKTGETPLMVAVEWKRITMIERLIEAGADINRQNNAGVSALMLAVSGGQKEIIVKLLEAGADISLRAKDGTRAIDCASSSDVRDLLRRSTGGVNEMSTSFVVLRHTADNGRNVEDVYDFSECTRLRTILNADFQPVSTTIKQNFEELAGTPGLSIAFNTYRAQGGKAEMDVLTGKKQSVGLSLARNAGA